MAKVEDKLYVKGQRFADRMTNLLTKMKYELRSAARKELPPPTQDYTAAIVGALAAGLLVGSVVSLLLAPDSGKKTREKIAKSLKENKKKKKQSAKLEDVNVGEESALEKAKKSKKEFH